jgi:hypothetical protein
MNNSADNIGMDNCSGGDHACGGEPDDCQSMDRRTRQDSEGQYDELNDGYEDEDDSEFVPSPNSNHMRMVDGSFLMRQPLSSNRRRSSMLTDDSAGGKFTDNGGLSCTPSGRKRRVSRQECFIEKLFSALERMNATASTHQAN